MDSQERSVDYQTLKQKRDDLITAFLDSKAHNSLLCFLDEYEELTCQMLQYIKQKETNDLQDRKWLESYLSLGE